MSAYYILLCEKLATKVNKGLAPLPRPQQINANQSQQNTQVLEGSLWRVDPDGSQSGHRKTADLHSVEFEGVMLQRFPLNSEEIQKLSKDHFDLLFAVPTCKDRFAVFQDKQYMAEATHIQMGSIVYMINIPGFTESKIPGRVRYRGPLSGQNGTSFGVELTAEQRGKGTTDGMFKRKRYFTCHMDSALFQPISKLAYCPHPEEFHEGPLYYLKAGAVFDQRTLPPVPPLTLGDRVVWINDTGVEKAVVKWIGILPDATEPLEWMVGVEFDRPVGTGTGKYKEVQLFKTKQGHASLIPVLGLLKESEYLGMFQTRVALPSPTHSTANTLKSPQSQTIPREETQHSPDEKYEPMRNDHATSLPRKPASGSFSHSIASSMTGFCDHDTVLLPSREADQYSLGYKPNQSANKPIQASEPTTQDHLNRFNEHRFATVHSSQPTQQPARGVHDGRDISTIAGGDRPVHNKYKQQDRYPRADFSSLPPGRPAKNLREKDTMSIYDQHPYENVERGPEEEEVADSVYDDYEFRSETHSTFDEGDDWEKLPRSNMNGELNGQPRYNSSVDVRSNRTPRVTPGRFGAGSVDGLDTREYSVLTANNNDGDIMQETTDNVRPQTIEGAAKRRANYQHSNTDPTVFSPPDSTHHRHNRRGLAAVSMPTEQDFPPPVYPDGIKTEPRSHHHTTNIDGLDYRNIPCLKSSKAKSVDNIVKGVEHEPCPLHTANSVFYRPIARNDETLEEAYRNLLHEDSQSFATTPSSYVTAHEHQSYGSPVTSSGRPQQRSASHDTLDSGLSLYANPDDSHNTSSDTHTELSHHANEKPDPAFGKSDKIKYTGRGVDMMPITLTPEEAKTDLELGSTVEVVGNPENFRYGVVRWIGYFDHKGKPLVGLEMEVPNASCSDGSFGKSRPFTCPPKKGFYVYLNKVRKDSRFQENPDFLDRSLSQAFGSMECHDIPGDVRPPSQFTNLTAYIGRNRGIQGLHNSCYMDATLFSMFAFSTAFDHLLKPKPGSTAMKDKVQLVLREGIVNPLRESFCVRADKVMNLRVVLDEFSKVQGLTHAEKDPEEFLNSLLQDLLQADPFIKLSSGLHSYLYQMILEKDDQVILPSTQQLLALSFLQANLKLTEIPDQLIIQLPRCGKKYKMYPRIIPSLSLDITDILMQVPRECAICSNLATHECKDCFKHFGDGSLLEISFCKGCLERCHTNPKRSYHNPTVLTLPSKPPNNYSNVGVDKGTSDRTTQIPRVKLDLSAVICIETSHYVAFVRTGREDDSAWLFFDSMADRMGEQHGYNIPQVTLCRDLPECLREHSRDQIMACKDDRDLPDHVKRILCDGYICMYERQQDS